MMVSGTKPLDGKRSKITPLISRTLQQIQALKQTYELYRSNIAKSKDFSILSIYLTKRKEV